MEPGKTRLSSNHGVEDAPPKGGLGGAITGRGKSDLGDVFGRCTVKSPGQGRNTGVPNHRGVGSGTLGHP
jgi:hypothetical protein